MPFAARVGYQRCRAIGAAKVLMVIPIFLQYLGDNGRPLLLAFRRAREVGLFSAAMPDLFDIHASCPYVPYEKKGTTRVVK
jgi:hypothetical protein